MAWWQLTIFFVVFAVVVLIVYNLLNIFVLSRLKVSRWVVLGAAVLDFVLPLFLKASLQGSVLLLIQSGIFVILFLWFMDLNGFGRRRTRKKDDLVIRPKAKPNRVKKEK